MSGPERDSSESAWEVLPLPVAIPLEHVDAYRPPATDSLDPLALRLVSLTWVAWALGTTIVGCLTLFAELSSTSHWDHASGVVFGIPCLMLAAWAWYRVFFAPRLTLDEEGLRFRTYGLGREELSLAWSEIHDVRLAQRETRLGKELNLSVALRSDGARSGSHHGRRSLDLPLGMAGFKRLDRAFARYCPSRYSSPRY